MAPFSPVLGMQSSVTRSTRAAGVVGPEWAITVEEALRMYTESSAWCAFEEEHVGTVAVGRAADLTCLSENVLETPDALADAEVVWTMAGGTVTYERS